MNVFFFLLRRIALGGTVLLILSFVLKGGLPTEPNIRYALIVSPVLYLVFVLFTYLKVKHSTGRISEEVGVDISYNNYFVTLFRSFFIDLFSPIGVIIGLFGDMETKVQMFFITYLVVLASVGVWFFVL